MLKVLRVFVVRVSRQIKQVEIYFYFVSGYQDRLRVFRRFFTVGGYVGQNIGLGFFGLIDRVMIKGMGLEGCGQIVREGLGCLEVFFRVWGERFIGQVIDYLVFLVQKVLF